MTAFVTDVGALPSDAGIVRIRSERPEDADQLRAMHRRVSADTLDLRFFRVGSVPSIRDTPKLRGRSDPLRARRLARRVRGEVALGQYARRDGRATKRVGLFGLPMHIQVAAVAAAA